MWGRPPRPSSQAQRGVGQSPNKFCGLESFPSVNHCAPCVSAFAFPRLTILYNFPASTPPPYDLNYKKKRCAMKFPLEYHSPVRRSVPASLALLVMFFLPSVLLSAQVNSSAPSSAGHSGYAPGHTSIPSSTNSSHSVGNSPHSTSGSQSVHHNPSHSASGSSGVVYYPYLYAVPYPYVADDNSANNTDAPGDND